MLFVVCCRDNGNEFIRSVSSPALELLYWNVPLAMQVKQIDRLENAQWHTHHCKLGWYSKGILQAAGNEHRVISMDVTHDQSMMAFSSVDAEVKVLQYPCIDAQASAHLAIAHAPLVTKVRFTCDSQKLITLGAKDQCIMQWRMVETKLHPKVQVLANKAQPNRPLYQIPCHDQVMTTMYEPISEPIRHEKPPTSHLELEFVHGYGGHNNNSNIFITETGELLYNAGALCVIFDGRTGSQQFFSEHQNDVMALTLHPDGLHVASADLGPSPAVCVWDVEAMVCISRLDGGGLPGLGSFEFGVSALAFHPQKNGTLLAAVGADRDHTLYLIDWNEKRTVAAGKCGSGRVFCCTYSPYGEMDLITCGVMHVKFWKRSGNKLVGREGVFGKRVKKCTMQCVDVNPANFVQHAGQKGVTLTGGMDGRIYLFGSVMSDGEWRPEVLNDVVSAHTGPVFDICHDRYTLLIASCGGDGLIKTWKLTTYLNPKDRSKTEIALLLHENIRLHDLVTDLGGPHPELFVKTVLFNKGPSGPVMIWGTNTGEILQCAIDETAKVVKDKKTHQPLPATLLLSGQGGDLTDLCTHPTEPLAFSVGYDCVLNMWDLKKKCLLAKKFFEKPIVSMDFAAEISRIVVAADDGTLTLVEPFFEDGADGVDTESNDEESQKKRERFQEIATANAAGPEPGFKWKDLGSEAPRTGTEITNKSLSMALQKRVQFSHEELHELHAVDLSYESYIKVGDKYFKPAGPVTMVRFSTNVNGEYFLAVGRTDGLVDFFNVSGNLQYAETSQTEGNGFSYH